MSNATNGAGNGAGNGAKGSAVQQISARENDKARATMIVGRKLHEVARELMRYGIDADVIEWALQDAARDAATVARRQIAAEDAAYEAAQ